MIDASYQRHFKLLGKLAKLYDTAGVNATADQLLLATTADQIADGTVTTLPALLLFQGYLSLWNNSVASGSTALQTLAVSFGRAYVVNATFTAGLTTTPASSTVADVLAAFQTEMGAGVDDKTLSTEASTGLVNFLDTLLGSEGTWNTEADATADYKDSVFCVSTVV